MDLKLNEMLALLTALILFFVLYILKKKKLDFGIRTIIALILGGIVGFGFRDNTMYVAMFGRIYVNLISAIVVPLIAISIIKSVINLDSTTKLKSIGLKSVGWLTSNTLIASILTLFIAFLFNVGNKSNITLPTDYIAREVPTLNQVIIDFFPRNIFSAAADNNIIPIIITSLAVGLAILSIKSKDETKLTSLVQVIGDLANIIDWIIKKIIALTPYAVLSLISNAVSNNGIDKLLPLFLVLLVAYLICFIQTFIVNGLLISLFAKLDPRPFFKKIWPAQIVAFTSQSSAGTIPVTVKSLVENLGVSDKIASFTAPLGATVGMPGCAGIWPVLLAVFAIQGLGIEYSLAQYVFLVILTVIVSLGTAGVPGTATITATAVFVSAGLPIETIVLLTPISSIVDMARTMTNVTGAATSALIVAQSEKELNKEQYYR